MIDLGYRARPQFEPFHARKARWSCVVSHVRAGKTVACIMDLIDACLRCDLPEPRFAYVAPYYAQAKDVAWNYVKRFTLPIPGAEVNETELRVDLPGGRRIRLYGADNYDRMRGIYLDGVVLDEFADFHPAAWSEVIRPRLSDRRGWATFIGTPKGRNAFWEIWQAAQKDPTWFTLMLRASETQILDPEELADAAKSMTPEQYAQEYECSFDAAILGAYYGRELADADRDGRITDVPVDPAIPVHTAWDLGKNDATSIFFWQQAPNGIAVIDHYENHGFDLDHYVAEIKARGYRYGTHYLPHDARARILGMKHTRVEQLLTMLRPDKVQIVADHKVEDGIAAGRLTIGQAWFDKTKCAYALECLRQYRTEYDEKAKVFKATPKHDWTSHCADSWRYLAMAWREPRVVAPSKPKINFTYVGDETSGTIKSTVSISEIIKRSQRASKRRSSLR